MDQPANDVMTEATGRARLRNRFLNKGTAFSREERDRYDLNGLLPPVVETLEQQLQRTRMEYDTRASDLDRHIFLRQLQSRNSVLFYAFITRNLEETLPIVYTPTVGLACQEWSRIYRQEHGLYLCWNDRHRIPEMLDNALDGLEGDLDVDVIVVSDGERILGLGDLGAGGMGIPIGKLALYTAVGGINPARSLPVLLDVGTDNEALLSDPIYLGWRSRRVRGDEYDELVDAFIDAVAERLPHAVVQWEDFAQQNARRLLDRHRDRVSSFNDDIQGTAAVSAAAVRAGLGIAGVNPSDLRVVIVGAGSAGTGVADELVRFLQTHGLTEEEAISRCWLIDRHGLLHDTVEDVDKLLPFQTRYLRRTAEVPGAGSLVEVVETVQPHAMIGVSGQPGLFTEEAVRAMASATERPIILPLSNPTPRAEAIPADVISWTDGRALVGTGSPFDPVVHDGKTFNIAQVNNVYIFPGVGLGAVAAKVGRITDSMITAAAGAVADLAVAAGDARLLPHIEQAAGCAYAVAVAVAEQAVADGVCEPLDAAAAIDAYRWRPEYLPPTS